MKLIAFSILLSLSALTQAADPPLSAAVFDFKSSGDKLANKGSEAALLLATRLTAAPNLMLVERQELDKALGEQELGLSGTMSAETAAKVGALTGAKVLITGRVFEAGSKYYLVAKVISSETSRVFGEAVSFDDPATLDKAVEELTPKITALLDNLANDLVAHVEDPGARQERRQKLLGGHKLPRVSIVIAEQHLGRPTIDPAVETEWKHGLQELGFEVIDPKASAKQADISISGEGFSETAGRHGQLFPAARASSSKQSARPKESCFTRIARPAWPRISPKTSPEKLPSKTPRKNCSTVPCPS